MNEASSSADTKTILIDNLSSGTAELHRKSIQWHLAFVGTQVERHLETTIVQQLVDRMIEKLSKGDP